MLAERKRVGQVADIGGCSEATVKRVRRRFLDEGWKRAVYDAPKPGRPPAVTIREEQAFIALACSRPPDSAARWTIRWLAERSGHSFNPLVQPIGSTQYSWFSRKMVLSRGGEKMWCIPALDDVYNSRMTDILITYERPYDAPFPVICLDEKSVS